MNPAEVVLGMGVEVLQLWNLWAAAGVVAGFLVRALRHGVICRLPAWRHWGSGSWAAQLLNEPAALLRWTLKTAQVAKWESCS